MASSHRRNTEPMLKSLRCGAKTRSGKPCRAPAVVGKERCRMHGGAAGSGAPIGNTNALKTGLHMRQHLDVMRELRRLRREGKRFLKMLK